MRSRIRKALNVRANGPWIIAAALLVALLVAPFAGAFGEGNNVRGGVRNPSSNESKAYTKETRDHRQREHVRHAPVEQVQQRRRRRLRLPFGRRRHAEGQRALRAREQSGRRPRVRVQLRQRHRGRRHHRPGDGGAVHDDRHRCGHRPECRQGRRQGADEMPPRRPKFATVSDGGTLADQRGATAAARSAAGVYSVDLRLRREQVRTDRVDQRRRGGHRHTRRRPAPTTVAVHTFDVLPAVTAADRSFHLVVTC